MKRHSWKKPDKKTNGIFLHHKVCRNCDLHKAVHKKKKGWIEVFYFEMDIKGNIIYGGIKINRVPYGCGDKKPIPKFLLEDELFEI